MAIEKTLKAMVEIDKNKPSAYIGEGQFDTLYLDFKKPATEADIVNFEEITGCVLPEDYKKFLLFTNGLIFFRAGDFRLFGIDEVIEVQRGMDYKNGVYAIGCILEDYIVINSDEVNSGRYLYYGPAVSSSDFRAFGHNFEIFLDRLLMSQIEKYWDWFPNEYHDFSG